MSGSTNPIPTVMPTVHTLPVDRFSTHATKDEAWKPSPCVMSQVDSMARKLVGQSARMVSERSWLRVPVGHVPFPPLRHLMVQCGSVLRVQTAKGLSRRFRHGSEQIQGQSNYSNEAGGNRRRSTVRLCNLMVRVLPRYARGPEFESRSDHVLFSSPFLSCFRSIHTWTATPSLEDYEQVYIVHTGFAGWNPTSNHVNYCRVLQPAQGVTLSAQWASS